VNQGRIGFIDDDRIGRGSRVSKHIILAAGVAGDGTVFNRVAIGGIELVNAVARVSPMTVP
jgi:hypothetical protein